jgi:hypothetical protein
LKDSITNDDVFSFKDNQKGDNIIALFWFVYLVQNFTKIDNSDKKYSEK